MTGTQKKGTSLTAGASLMMFAKTLSFAFGFVLPLLLVRRLSQGDFGLYKQVFLVAGTATAVFSLNFGMSAFYFLPREEGGRRGAVIVNILLFNLLAGAAALLVLACFPQVLTAVFNSSDLVPYAPLIGLVVLLWVFSFFVEVVAVANQELRAATIFIVAAQLTKTALLLGAALVFGSVRALIYAALAQALLQTAVLFLYLRSRFPGFWRSFEWPVLRAQLAYALPLGLYGLLWTAQVDLHNYFVSHSFGAAAFAVYAVGCFDLPLVSMLGESVGSVMLPRVSLLQKRGETREIVLVTVRAMRKLAAVYFPLYALLIVVGRHFIVFMFTERYAESWPLFAINLTLVPFSILMLDPISRAYAEHRFYLLRVRVVVLCLLVAALWFGTARLGLAGAIAAVVAANLLERLVVALKFGRVLGVGREDAPLLKDVAKIAAATLAAAGVALGVRTLMSGAKPFYVLACCGVVFALAYVGGLLALGVPEQEERDAARRGLARLRGLLPRRGKSAEAVAATGSEAGS
jgi:O-antigen/teichoic acid export membrane protein